MAFIGSLEQYDLSDVLRRVEVFTKTGLLVVKQGEQWVELYFRQGLLVCIGPVRPNVTLGDRLLQSGVITRQAWQEAITTIGFTDLSETRMAITLIDLGYVSQETLYNWLSKEITRVLQVLLAWPSGEIYFEDDYAPPSNRLLLSFSVATLLQSFSNEPGAPPLNTADSEAPSVSAASAPTSPVNQEDSLVFKTGAMDAPGASGLLSADELLGDVPDFSTGLAALSPELSPLMEDQAHDSDSFGSSNCSLLPPQPVSVAPPPMYVDISFMQPTMVMVPLDLSSQRERNPQAALTPEQWRLFTKADGSTSLLVACQALGMSRKQVCQVAGELTALGLIKVVMPSPAVTELSPSSRDRLMNRTTNDLLQSGRAVPTNQLWPTAMPGTGNLPDVAEPAPMETDSQWGNGGNGARFVLGGGWMLSSSPQPVQSIGPFHTGNQVYVSAGGR